MDPQADSDEEFIVLSTSDYTESTSYHITGGFGGSGGEGHTQGGDGGIIRISYNSTRRCDGAEEEWRKDVAKYESIWDPRIMQVYGLVSTKGLYAMVFHDELIPYVQFLRRFQHSPILRTYIFGYCTTECHGGDQLY
ncbi:hypothetical protein MSAN_01506800 [Mycena sanguinolenta]|uniref:Uncharacterized protein n=1 Tax=Mycena sanguinolenta TaxID=230812 RepID=A0A8H6Y5U6_9AGAR|nr:hypothetical protein MSAN_01506800 [Mycena sanguinolenta]